MQLHDVISRQAAIDAVYTANGTGTALKALKQLPPAQPDGEYISRQAVTESDLIDWYINSVDESEPVWTEEHIHELFNDFYLIPKEN